ncbi:hypothetical protein GCM10009548_67120 [Streptomyces malaysiensis subsp. malaysiensis]
MAGRHQGAPRQRRDVERLGVVAVHPVAGPPQPDEVIEILPFHPLSFAQRPVARTRGGDREREATGPVRNGEAPVGRARLA